MEFGLSGVIQLASRSATSSLAGRRPANDLLASWIAPDRPNSITLSSSLAGRRPAGEPARELVRVMEFDLYETSVCKRSIELVLTTLNPTRLNQKNT